MARLKPWLYGVGFVGLVCGVLLGAYLLWLYQQLPPLTNLSEYEPALITRVYDRHGALITEISEERRVIVPVERLPQHVIRAFLAAEDDNFYHHWGVEPLAILRAAWKNFVAGGVRQGASTITQQVAKTFFLTPERRLVRKIKELFLALRLERNFSKNEILFLYLNQIYFGRGAYGIGAAAEMYFDTHAWDLDVAEAAMLAGLPKAPSRYAPHVAPELARERQLYVLERMEQTGWLTAAEAQTWRAERTDIHRWESPFWQATYAAAAVRNWLLLRFDEETVKRGGLRVYTTFDLEALKAAEEAVRKGLRALDRRQGYRGPVTSLRGARAVTWQTERQVEFWTEMDHERHPTTMHTVPVSPTVRPQPVTRYVPEDWDFPAMVTGFTKDGRDAWVDFGPGMGRVPVEAMRWAREPDPEVAAGVETVAAAADVLKLGDVIRVARVDLDEIEADEDRQAMENRLEAAAAAPARPGTLPLQLEQIPEVEGALVSVIPETGEVIALVGGYDFRRSQFNRALQARRQPGSAFKPIVYAAALEHGYTPASILVDTPIVYEDLERETRWKPKNYEGRFYGPMTLLDALTFSRNVVTIQLVRDLGIKRIQAYARRLGIESPLPDDLSMSLGSGVVTPMELARVYSSFANKGIRPDLSMVREVWDATGSMVYSYFPPVTTMPDNAYNPFVSAPPPSRLRVPFRLRAATRVPAPGVPTFSQAVSRDTAFQVAYMLRNVIERGTGWRARALGRPAAGKTGTTDGNRDSWFAGFTPQYATVAWVGFDELAPLGRYETGSRAASPIWVDYMREVHRGLPVREFAIPDSIEFRRIHAKTGAPATPLDQKVLLVPFGPDDEIKTRGDGDAPGTSDDALFDQEEDYLHSPQDW